MSCLCSAPTASSRVALVLLVRSGSAGNPGDDSSVLSLLTTKANGRVPAATNLRSRHVQRQPSAALMPDTALSSSAACTPLSFLPDCACTSRTNDSSLLQLAIVLLAL